MPEIDAGSPAPLDARNPFMLRINLGRHVPEVDIREALATGEMGFLHSFTTGATVDGPGPRVVAWTTGCMWRCQYCHNPDTWTMSNGMPVTVARAANELRKYTHALTPLKSLKPMRGGFTLSGGEPLMQHRFAAKLLNTVRATGIHTALATNGYYGDRLSDSELEAIDLVLLDMKAWDPTTHRNLTSMDNGPTLDFARRLAALNRRMWLRFVVVPGLTANHRDIAKIAHFAAGLGNVERVDVLPFHQMGKYKWKQLGIDYALHDVEPPSVDNVARACGIFRDAGLMVA